MPSMKIKLDNCRMILPGRRVADGELSFENGVITEIVEKSSSPDKIVIPGLVNCHGHTAMTLVRGLGSGLPLSRWLEEAIFPVEAKMTRDDVRAGVTRGVMEMFAGGTTAVADMYDFPDVSARVFEETGMKADVCRVGLNFIDGRLAECVEFMRSPACVRRAVADVCIHSEYLTDEKFCRELAEATKETGRPLHVHVSETKREHDECIARHGRTPIAYLASTGLLDNGAYAAHCVWCTDDDFAIMREKNVTLVHNPSSNMKLGSGFARIPEALAAGVNVALGTDGCASNDNLDMFEEMHLASLVHKGVKRDPLAVSAWDVVEMATVNGARALNRGDVAGELRVGSPADLCVVDMQRLHLEPDLDTANLVVSSMHASDVVMTVAGGEIVYERGDFPTLDAGRARFDFKCAVRDLFRRAGITR